MRTYLLNIEVHRLIFFYATNRSPIYPGSTDFGNELDSVVHLGTATIRMGTPDIDWDDLYKSSLADNASPLPLTLDKVNEMALLPAQDTHADHIITPELQAFADAINAELAIAVDKEIMVYVHGTKVDFTNATILTAEIDHFAGRDFVGLAYAWPSHQNILVYLTGADVEVDKFLSRLPAISELADQVIITVTDDDNALKAAKKCMHGNTRAGTADAEIIEERFIVENKLTNVEIIDVSRGQEIRGFDITGHHYWYRHPWMSSDIIFLMRTNLPPERRGLSPTELEGIWYLAEDYPEKIQDAAEKELNGQW